MTQDTQQAQPDDDAVQAYIAQQVYAGADKGAVAAGLEDMGVPHQRARDLVATLYPKLARAAKEQAFTADALLPAAIGGLVAAVVGGGVWAAIVVYAGYELGIVAWGIGLLAGWAVVQFAKGRRGMPLQAIAVAASVLGIAVGKYFAFYHYYGEAVLAEFGEEAAAGLSVLSADMLLAFVDNAQYLFGGFDILWVILAVITAWRIPQGGILIPGRGA